ncbi:hypothetical protein VPH35_140882 [Triticum aestivum]
MAPILSEEASRKYITLLFVNAMSQYSIFLAADPSDSALRRKNRGTTFPFSSTVVFQWLFFQLKLNAIHVQYAFDNSNFFTEVNTHQVNCPWELSFALFAVILLYIVKNNKWQIVMCPMEFLCFECFRVEFKMCLLPWKLVFIHNGKFQTFELHNV